MFECFHNFVAFSQWGNTLYNIMLKLSRNDGDARGQNLVQEDHGGQFRSSRAAAAFTAARALRHGVVPHDLAQRRQHFRLEEMRTPPFARHGYIVTPHTSTSLDPVHWEDPDKFDPSRYS